MLKTTIHNINELIPDPDNVRQHGEENHAALVRSIERFGIRKPIVAHESSKIVYAGNETLNVALELGMSEIPVAWIPAETSEAVCRAYAIADNRTTDLSEFDDVRLVEALTALQEDGEIEIGDVGFTLDDLEGFADDQFEPEEDDFDPDEAMQEKAVSQTGDIWHLGEHRLICGDCTDADVVDRLMQGEKAVLCLTDPPYGVNMDYGMHEDNPETNEALVTSAFLLTTKARVWSPGLKNLARELAREPDVGVLAWHRKFSVGWPPHGSSWATVWEPILVTPSANGRLSSDHLEFMTERVHVGNKAIHNTHPCPKPVALWAVLCKGFSSPSDIVYDPFLGSGTTMIACEQLGRKCYGIEIGPLYVDLCVRRFVEYVGTSDDVYLERDGERVAYDTVRTSYDTVRTS